MLRIQSKYAEIHLQMVMKLILCFSLQKDTCKRGTLTELYFDDWIKENLDKEADLVCWISDLRGLQKVEN
jgi:hypothetical protein